MPELWYFEVAGPSGNWMPRTMAGRPITKTVNGSPRLAHGEGQGPRVRHIAEVPEFMHDATLDQLALIMPRMG